MNEKQYFIAYFPYLSMGDMDEIDLGFGKVWNFDKKKDEYIPDQKFRKKLEKILRVYKSNKQQISGIGVISLGENDFRVYTQEEREIIKIIRLILFLVFIAKNNIHKPGPNTGHGMLTSDNFEVVYQNFVLENDFVSESGGIIVRYLIGGYKLGETTVQKPTFVPTPYRPNFESDLLWALLELHKNKPRVFKRIINATEIFLESYYNTHQLSKNARILLQTSAFEMLLNLPYESGARKRFKELIKEYCVSGREKLYDYQVKISDKKKVSHKLTKKEIWGDKLFTLRNSIIHGDKIKENDFYFGNTQAHYDIGVLFFLLFIDKQIEKSVKKYKCYISIDWQTWVEPHHPKDIKRSGFVYDTFRLRIADMLGE